MPRVARIASSPTRSSREPYRPSSPARASSAPRSCDFARAEERAAASSAAQAIDARASTTSSSATNGALQLSEALRSRNALGDDDGQQPRLRDDQQRTEHAERDRAEQEPPRRARVPEQSRIEGSHGAIMTALPAPYLMRPRQLDRSAQRPIGRVIARSVPAPSEEAEAPADERGEAVLEAGHEGHVHDQPHEPAEEARHPHALEARRSRADGRRRPCCPGRGI